MVCELYLNKAVKQKYLPPTPKAKGILYTPWEFQALQIKFTSPDQNSFVPEGESSMKLFLEHKAFLPKILERSNTLNTTGNP